MTQDEFWNHIQATRRKDPEVHAERLAHRLTKLPLEEILEFSYWWDIALAQAYRWDLWGAAFLINCGCSDDGFEYFRRWLVLQGRTVFETAVKDPDSLAQVIDPEEEMVECECYPAWDAWFAATKRERDEAGYNALMQALKAQNKKPPKSRPGRQWDFEDETQTRRRLPQLSALYLDRD